jgi:hypothetical protein
MICLKQCRAMAAATVAIFIAIAAGEVRSQTETTTPTIEIKASSVLRVDNADGIQKIGDGIYIDQGRQLATTPVGVFRVTTEGHNFTLKVSDINRDLIEPKKLTDGVYEIAKLGTFWVDVRVVDFKKEIFAEESAKITIVGPSPPEPGPKPPGPDPPGPNPPDPKPPGPAPIEGLGLRVLFLVESFDRSTLSPGHREILFGEKMAQYLNANCVKSDDGKQPEWRVLDPETRFTNQDARFAKALARARSSHPWLIISNGETGYEGPLPDTVEETMLLIDSFIKSKKKLTVFTPEPKVEPVSNGNTSVVMLSLKNCSWCEAFKKQERDKLKIPFTEITGTTLYPTFVVRHAGKEKRIAGYATADQIHKAVEELGGVN